MLSQNWDQPKQLISKRSVVATEGLTASHTGHSGLYCICLKQNKLLVSLLNGADFSLAGATELRALLTRDEVVRKLP